MAHQNRETILWRAGAVFAVGALLTAALMWTAWSIDERNESRLLNLQAKQVQAVLVAAIPSTQIPLELGAEVAASTGGDISKFRSYMITKVGTRTGFSYASLWSEVGGSTTELTALGIPHASTTQVQSRSLVANAFRSSTFVVTEKSAGSRLYLAYAFALPGTGTRFAVYVERPIPANRHARVARNAAFSDLNYAIYLGRSKGLSALLTTNFDRFPISGKTATVTVPIGNSVLTTVVQARAPLAGALSADLPWIIGILGLVISVSAAFLAGRLMRGRRAAQAAEVNVQIANEELARRYREERTIAETLQRALLPISLPDICGLEAAARYLPGAEGADIGGDWYSLLPLGGERFVFVVGDVSGRGVEAAAIMARLRFTIRAHALDGDAPAEILDKCTRQLDLATDGHFATVLVGIGDMKRGQLTIASAGHLPPLLMSSGRAEFIKTVVNRPVGLTSEGYESVTISIEPPTTLIAFTDGLVERRDQSLDVGLNRLRDVVMTHEKESPDDIADLLLERFEARSSGDDIALLCIRWT